MSQPAQPQRRRALTGIKPTGTPHWGNYFGMIRPAIELAESTDAFYFIADYHALTTVREAAALQRDSREITAIFLACGLDPRRSVLFRQSDVPEVTELSWMLSCVTGLGLVQRAHAYKDAQAKNVELNFGTVTYPVLMAADILLYDTDVVPVGKDQVQHLEMARDMAGYFNMQFLGEPCTDEAGRWTGRGLKRPEAMVREATAVVPGIDGEKMSKSRDNVVPIFGSAGALKKRVMAVVTDSKPLEAPKDPTTCNVVALYKLFATTAEVEELSDRYRAGGYGYGHAKLALLEKARSHFEPMQERYDRLIAEPDTLEDVLVDGARRAREVALPVIDRVREATGLPRRRSAR